ncbi:uncharacterized protein LOC114531928 isoform X2 [Dendronephthya gigantea]|uniref:uncharacterized protein LOC114531928 isoform X2 n=1 Tax=Dendronephthya gigantea TaxID=151771 RepID=UPI00106C56B5|nr:uncharacterized protein LOC114531928 isoform X2 [Dendronephthya gigantea]
MLFTVKAMSARFAMTWYISSLLASAYGKIHFNITRGSVDRYTNPGCESGICIKSCSFGASCTAANNCFECHCDAKYPTFYGAKCVRNERLSLSLDDSQSFLANRFMDTLNNCLVPYFDAVSVTTADTCDLNNTNQHWIWTKHGQLLNVYTLKCLQTSNIPVFKWYPKVRLTKCNASDSRQVWTCLKEKGLVRLRYLKQPRYLNYGNVLFYVIVFRGTGIFSQWKRYSTKQPLCSSVSAYHGCYKYLDGSRMFIIKRETLNNCKYFQNYCELEKHISAPIEVSNNGYCYIDLDKTEFLNYSRWHYIPKRILDIRSFQIVKRNSETITLKVNLTAAHHLRGHIIKIYIGCRSKNDERSSTDQLTPTEQGGNETHCVLVKFSGEFKDFSSVKKDISSTTMSAYAEKNQSKSDSSTLVIVIVVCIIAALLLAAIVLYVVFKRKRRGTKETNETTNEIDDDYVSLQHAETSNPVYYTSGKAKISQEVQSDEYETPVDAASTECTLYEANVDEIVYSEPQPTFHAPEPDSEITYDYAIPD